MADEHNWAWYYSHNDEHFYGPHASREEAIKELCGEVGFICEAYQGSVKLADWIRGDRLIADADEAFAESELSNRDNDAPFFEMAPEQEEDLLRSVKAAVDEWQKRHNLVWPSWGFGGVRNREQIDEMPGSALNDPA